MCDRDPAEGLVQTNLPENSAITPCGRDIFLISSEGTIFRVEPESGEVSIQAHSSNVVLVFIFDAIPQLDGLHLPTKDILKIKFGQLKLNLSRLSVSSMQHLFSQIRINCGEFVFIWLGKTAKLNEKVEKMSTTIIRDSGFCRGETQL